MLHRFAASSSIPRPALAKLNRIQPGSSPGSHLASERYGKIADGTAVSCVLNLTRLLGKFCHLPACCLVSLYLSCPSAVCSCTPRMLLCKLKSALPRIRCHAALDHDQQRQQQHAAALLTDPGCQPAKFPFNSKQGLTDHSNETLPGLPANSLS